MYTTKIMGHYASISLATLRSRLTRVLKKKEAYDILDRTIDGADIWVAGGCLLLANALKILIPEGQVAVALGQEEIPEHTVFLYQNFIIDGDGVSTWEKFKDRWEKMEGISITRLEPLDYQKHHADYIDNAKTQTHKKGEKELAAYLSQKLR